jgi:hypothetical protein
MTPIQKKTIGLGIAAFVLMGAFPPWIRVVTTITPASVGTTEDAAGYAFLFSPPEQVHSGYDPFAVNAYVKSLTNSKFELTTNIGFHIDFVRLIIQWIILLVVVGGIVLLSGSGQATIASKTLPIHLVVAAKAVCAVADFGFQISLS